MKRRRMGGLFIVLSALILAGVGCVVSRRAPRDRPTPRGDLVGSE